MSKDSEVDPVVELAGVPHGTVLETPEGQPNEIVVADYDEEGNVVGWHKELEKK